MKKIKDCSFCFFKKFISFCKKIISTPLIFIFVFFISQASGSTLVSAYSYFNPASYQIFHAGVSSGEQISSFTQASYTSTTINSPHTWGYTISDDFIFYDELYYPIENSVYYTSYGYATVCAPDNATYPKLSFCDMYGEYGSASGDVDITGLANGDYVFIANWPGDNHILWFRILSGEISEIFNPVYFSTPETCTDGIMNQDETGVDTGGVCGWNSEIILEKEITSFGFKNLTPNVDGIIDEVNNTITLNVPFGTDITTIVPTITISSGASVNPNDNISQNFSSPVIYTVTATDMSTQTYTVTVIVAKPTHNPVILIPGITGTYLIRDYGDKTEIWPDISRNLLSLSDLFLNDLALEIDGTENIEMPIKIGDIIRGITLPAISNIHVFDRLISELIDNGGYVEGEDLFVFPYDWRISTSLNAILLKEKIEEILLETGYENVDIVAHSMGGLIAKKYIADNRGDKIDQLIFLGTPQLGAPKAFKTLMFGDNMGIGVFIFGLNSNIIKIISQNMPSVYELLPSEKYVESNGSYVINALDRENAPINLSYEQTKDLMIEKGRNVLMFPFAEDLHNSIDDLDLSGIETHNFVGCGTKTIGGITTKQKLSWDFSGFHMADDFDLKYVNGDATVPLESANKTIGANIYFANGNSHGSLPSAEGVRQNILSILKGEDLQDYSNILTDVSTCNISGKVVSTHSPVELHIYDEEGNHTGPNSNGDIEYNVAGVQYDVIDGEKFAFLPDGVNYKIVTQATDTGGYNFQIKDLTKNDEVTATYDWTLIPLETLQAKGEILVGPGYPASEYKVTMDNNGDNIPDTTISSNLPADFKFYLNVLRKTVDLLGLEKKIRKDILNKIDKVEKEYNKNKKGKEPEKLTKLLQKISSNKGKLKDISLVEKNVIINSINTLLDILK